MAAENEGQCFRLNVLYDWGTTVSMISEEAVEVMGLAITKQAKRIIKGLGGVTTVSKGTSTLSLVARNGDRKIVTAWEVGEIASLPGGQPPEDVDEQFPGLRYLSEPNCLSQKAGPVHVLLGMDHAHLMPEHVAESTDLNSQLRLMSSMFGGQHILVGEGAPRLSWIDAMDADERYEAAANGRRKREECRKMAQEARQTALKHTHKLPRRLWDDEKEKSHPTMRGRPQGSGECGPSCRERRMLWKEELSSLSTLVRYGGHAPGGHHSQQRHGAQKRSRRVLEVEDRTWNGRDIDHGLLDGAADHRDGGHESDYEDPEASRRNMEAWR